MTALPLKLAGGALFLLTIALALRYPVAPWWLAGGLIGYAALQLKRPLAWLFVLPATLPLLDLAPWSGRIYLEDFDLPILSTVAVALWQGRYALLPMPRRHPGLGLILGLLSLSYAVSLAMALWPPPPLDANSFASYLSPYNGLRHVKPFFWILLLLPALYFALREGSERAMRHFAWGATAGLAAVGLVAMWERGVFVVVAQGADRYGLLGSLLDYTSSYRITGLFHDMHTGGEAIDGFLALTWPAALWLLFTARARGAAALAAAALALGLYAVTVTFSRADYLALVVGLLVMAIVVASALRGVRSGTGSGAGTPRWLALSTPPALAFLVVGLAITFREGGMVVLVVELAGLVGAALLGMYQARLSWRLGAGLLALLSMAVAAAAAYGLATSKWLTHDLSQSLSLGAGLTSVVAVCGMVVGVFLAGHLRPRQFLAVLTLVVISVGAVFPALFGFRMAERTTSFFADLDTRAEHWRKVLDLRGDAFVSILLGKGLGRFPSEYLWRHVRDEIGVYALNEEAGNRYMTLGAGADLTLGQRLALVPGHDYQLRLRARLHDPAARLGVKVCRRHLLQFEQWNPSCVPAKLVAGGDGSWRTLEADIRWPRSSDGVAEWLRHPPALQLINHTDPRPGVAAGIDVDEVRLLDAAGRDLVTNGGFDAGIDHWLAYYDFHHLEWHMKNLWVHLAFDQGWLGVAAMLAWCLYALGRAWRLARAGNGAGVYLLGALTAVLTIGMFGTLLDVPRVAWLILLTLAVASLVRHEPAAGWSATAGQPARGLAAARRSTNMPVKSGRKPGAGPRILLGFSWGAALLVVAGGGIYLASRNFGADPGLVVAKMARGFGLRSNWLEETVAGVPDYRDHVLDGRFRASHPRILLPQLAGWDGISVHPELGRREILDPLRLHHACAGNDLLWLTSCWLQTGRPAQFDRLVQAMRIFRLQEVTLDTSDVGNGWRLALAYDLIRATPLLEASERRRVELNILAALNAYLALLERPETSLWHGRASLAAAAWLCAIALDPERVPDTGVLSRAQGHFLDVMRALALSEAWPEGYNYWINSRAFLLTLAASAYLNGLEGAEHSTAIRDTLRRVGHWHIHALRPDNRIEALGDEGPRVDIKDETQRVIDLLATLTRDPVFTRFSRHIEALPGGGGYYDAYRWGKPLFQDPTLPSLPILETDSLRGLELTLPTAALFGPRVMDLAYIRSGWGRDDTFISYRAGKTLTHHAHYDAGHFTLFKGTPLAVKSGVYDGVTTAHRMYYAARTVAQNSLLVLRPGEQVRPNRLFTKNVAEGGQRLAMPTGSAVHSVREWQENLGAGGHFEGGEITAFDHRPGEYTYIASNLTPAYDNPIHDSGGTGGKVSDARRELLYLDGEDRLIVHDDVTSTRPEYVKKWLLHTMTRPEAGPAVARRGRPDDGILETRAENVFVRNGRGHLVVQRLLPETGLTRLVGGPGHRFYVEADGDDSDLDGFNVDEGVGVPRPWFDAGNWRIEFQPSGAARREHFLVAMSPSLDHFRRDLAVGWAASQGEGRIAATDRTVVVFLDRSPGRAIAFVRPGEQERLLLAGLPPLVEARISLGAWQTRQRGNAAGVVLSPLPAAQAGLLRVDW